MAKREFFIQWDSTNDCNLNCSHCYHNREGRDHANHIQKEKDLMSFNEVQKMLCNLRETAKGRGFKPRLQISGGEPLLRKDLMEILDYTKSLGIETMLLTNGTLITKDKAKELYRRGVKGLQVSIDGSKETHNRIRRRHYAYDKAIEGIRNSADAGILAEVSMTIMRSNRQDLEDVIKNSIRAQAGIVGFRSYVPDAGLGENDPEFVGAFETYSLYKRIRKLAEKYKKQIKVPEAGVLWRIMRRENGKPLNGCGAGLIGVSVLSDGTVYPCRRLPIPIGHISGGLAGIMTKSKVLKDLGNYRRGCRAIAYAVTGDYLAKDPMCFKQFVKENERS